MLKYQFSRLYLTGLVNLSINFVYWTTDKRSSPSWRIRNWDR